MDTKYFTKVIAREISRISRYADRVIQIDHRTDSKDLLLDEIDCSTKEKSSEIAALQALPKDGSSRSLVLLNGTFNHSLDIQKTLCEIKEHCTRNTRIVAVLYNPYYRFLYIMATWLGIRSGEQPSTFVTRTDLDNLAKISGFEVERARSAALCPFYLFGLGAVLNRLVSLVPLIRWFGFVYIATLRPIIPSTSKPSLSILIPARNERGNIRNALERMPDLSGAKIEVIFVEGHSNDGTWEEILAVKEEYKDRYKIKALQQTGKGKCDAVRLGFREAECDLLTILDADLTMPPELLPRFYEAYCRGDGDFINGSRLVYPMEGEAMRFLNRLGNAFFAKALSFVLDTRLGDSLCGTKLFTRRDYQRMVQWRGDFGDFDPFGDFELLFPAAILGLGLVDIPIRYRDRTYGSTNISRFYHGTMLLKMTSIGLFKVKIGSH